MRGFFYAMLQIEKSFLKIGHRMSDFFAVFDAKSSVEASDEHTWVWGITTNLRFRHFAILVLIGHPMSCYKKMKSDTIKSQQNCMSLELTPVAQQFR